MLPLLTMAREDIPQGPEPQYDRIVSGYETFHSVSASKPLASLSAAVGSTILT